MKSTFPFLILILILLFTGCSQSNSSSEEQNFIENKGSDTMVNLALAWAEEYQIIQKETNLLVTGGGSGTGIAALINGTVDIANASRGIKVEEYELASQGGSEPVEFIVARDAIAIIINHENPITELSLEQLSDIYSGKINNWKELGGDDRPIVRLSRETNSGTHVYFLEEVLRLGDKNDTTLFSRDTLLLPSSEGINSEVKDNPNAIGYDGLGYVTPEVKVVPISGVGSSDYIFPSADSVTKGNYPIARDLYMYTLGDPVGNIKEYIDWIYSPMAQAIVSELGFVPVSH